MFYNCSYYICKHDQERIMLQTVSCYLLTDFCKPVFLLKPCFKGKYDTQIHYKW